MSMYLEVIGNVNHKDYYLAFIIKKNKITGNVLVDKYYEYIQCQGYGTLLNVKKKEVKAKGLDKLLDKAINKELEERGWKYGKN